MLGSHEVVKSPAWEPDKELACRVALILGDNGYMGHACIILGIYWLYGSCVYYMGNILVIWVMRVLNGEYIGYMGHAFIIWEIYW